MRVIKSSQPGKLCGFCPPGTLILHGCSCLPAPGRGPWDQHLETWARSSAGHAELPGAGSRPPRPRVRSLTVSEELGASPRARTPAGVQHWPTWDRHFLTVSRDSWCLQTVQVLTGFTHRRICLNSNKNITRNQHEVENTARSSTMSVTYSRLIQPSLICLTMHLHLLWICYISFHTAWRWLPANPISHLFVS